jgi:hypothetical protein
MIEGYGVGSIPLTDSPKTYGSYGSGTATLTNLFDLD